MSERLLLLLLSVPLNAAALIAPSAFPSPDVPAQIVEVVRVNGPTAWLDKKAPEKGSYRLKARTTIGEGVRIER